MRNLDGNIYEEDYPEMTISPSKVQNNFSAEFEQVLQSNSNSFQSLPATNDKERNLSQLSLLRKMGSADNLADVEIQIPFNTIDCRQEELEKSIDELDISIEDSSS